MSKLYMNYLKNKNVDKDKYYLFRSGMFYIFIDEDAKNICKYVPLKITNLNKDIVKCGFPLENLNKYMEIFNRLGIDVVIVDNSNKNNNKDRVIKMIENIDIDNVSPLMAINMLYKFKGLLERG